MSERIPRLAAAATCAALACVLGACANRGTVILLPSSGEEKAAVAVRQGSTDLLLDEPYAAANTTYLFGPQPYRASAEEVEARFGAALRAQPARPATFVLYFEADDALTDASRRTLETILSEIAKRAAPDVQVVGHTDTVGTDAFNDALGLRRAQVVRDALVQRGIPASDIETLSRGRRELAVPTPDGVAEPRNRRVTIVIR